MTLVPIITLLLGYFPIALNLLTVIAITVYYSALHAVTYYCRSMREFRALWLANIGTSIMFWPYGKAALLTPFKQIAGKGLTFKSTSKGAQRSSVSLKEIGPSLLLVLLSVLAFLCGIVDFNINVNAPKAIALCWVLYNIVPHLLLLTYARFGSGAVLRFMCTFLLYAQSLISVLALILLWVLYPREENYVRATDLSLDFLYAQRSGQIVLPYPVDWRRSSGSQNVEQFLQPQFDALGQAVSINRTAVDLSGGFYTDGEVGPVKLTTHVAMTTSMLAWSLLDYQEWWVKDQGRLDRALELVQHGMEYVKACYVPNLSHPNGTSADLLVFQVRQQSRPIQRMSRPFPCPEHASALTLCVHATGGRHPVAAPAVESSGGCQAQAAGADGADGQQHHRLRIPCRPGVPDCCGDGVRHACPVPVRPYCDPAC